MARKPRKGDRIRSAIGRLENPYAFAQMEGMPDERTFAQRRSDYIRTLENQYASLSVDDGLPPDSPVERDATSEKASTRKCAKAEFRSRCRSIFAGYMPALEKGKLRDHHRDFILRNESRTPQMRYRLLVQLEKYDLSSHAGLNGRFNRERDIFTEEKLRRIERDAESGD